MAPQNRKVVWLLSVISLIVVIQVYRFSNTDEQINLAFVTSVKEILVNRNAFTQNSANLSRESKSGLFNTSLDLVSKTGPSIAVEQTSKLENKRKKILFWSTFYGGADLPSYCISGEHSMDFCPHECNYSVNQRDLENSDALVFHGREEGIEFPQTRSPNQRWVYLMFESPDHSWINVASWNDIFNWTMSYRSDSDVHIPYGSLINSTNSTKDSDSADNILEYSLNPYDLSKKRLAAWAVSNCGYVTSDRKALVDALLRHMPIDVYGICGDFNCEGKSTDYCGKPQECHKYLSIRYKFYLAFENSICEDYITEKFFNALRFGLVPVVHGPSRYFYEKLAPKSSFIHVADFANVQQLADYLLYLDKNDHAYLKYLEWRKDFHVGEINNYKQAWCSLCGKLHEDDYDVTREGNSRKELKTYSSIHEWWFRKRVEGEAVKSKTDAVCKRFLLKPDGNYSYY